MNQDGTFLTDEALKKTYKNHGISIKKPTISSCGSGLTACVLDLGLQILGN